MIEERQADAAELVMDLARHHHDEVEFYRAEIESTSEDAGPLYTRFLHHQRTAAQLRALAQYLDGDAEEVPSEVVSGRGMRSNDDGIPWERP